MKLFKNNTMTLIVDPRAIGPEINNMDFVAVACVNGVEDFKNHPNAYDASILLPPTELLMAWADGNQMLMRTEYPKYLINNRDVLDRYKTNLKDYDYDNDSIVKKLNGLFK